ncbi:cob(I)yrinic acid a,c-diamide adenosyltransferase [Ideonella sp. BN130291]|uniref:cob(I)yrinic acid a,c-diamide adenosyltransferase n=1 Tax=Ideonella sp. BN130291 TaxID=3112940 RepID=UPI002E265231|nr:cob(I)yrinic acid a,c-diamide adenosyltransferase [Ideonella sp. BN130291]
MQIETPPTEARYERPGGERRGLVLVHTGDGKGGWIALDAVLAALRERPPHVHVVLTGRGAPEELIALADTVTEMRLVKHHFQSGVPAQRGIED